jgi:hypothetical protein
MIAREGCLILIKAVMAARPLHLLLVADAPVWLLDEINKWMRSFFWVGKEEASSGQCLVAWANICKPTCFGALGVKVLCLQGMAFRVRWEWLRRTEANRAWQGLLMIKDVTPHFL